MDLTFGPRDICGCFVLRPSRTRGDFFDLGFGAITVLIKAGFMSLCHSLEERMELSRPGNTRAMMCMGGTGHALSICLDSCGMGVGLGTSGVAALMSCTSGCVFCCVSRNFGLGGKSVTQGGPLGTRFFFLLRTALKDRPKGPPTANRQPPTANHQPPPTASGDQAPTANHCQPPPTTNHQPPTAANHHQPPPTTSCQLSTANCRQPPTANRHQPWLSTWSARGLFWENSFRNTFFFR